MTWDQGLEIQPALSPDGRYVAYAGGTVAGMRIYVRQVTGGRVTRLTDDSLAVQTNPSWSADGSRILFLAGGGVYSAPSSGGPDRPEMRPVSQGPIVSAQWGPDGRTIAYAVRDSVYIRSPAGEIRPLARIPEASLCQWSPDGDRIACASGNAYYSRVGFFFGNLSPSRVVVVGVSDGRATIVTDSTSINQSPVWSHDGKWLYFVSSRLGPRDIYAVRDVAGRRGPRRAAATHDGSQRAHLFDLRQRGSVRVRRVRGDGDRLVVTLSAKRRDGTGDPGDQRRPGDRVCRAVARREVALLRLGRERHLRDLPTATAGG